MSSLARQRCLHHPQREAAARCPSCRRFYCRECVVDHSGRLLCTSCLAAETAGRRVHRAWWRIGARLVAAVAMLLVAWLFFYLATLGVLGLPAKFHEGRLAPDVEAAP